MKENKTFEEASEELETADPSDGSENVIEWIRGNKSVTVQLSGHSRLCNRVEKYAEEFPDEVQILGKNKNGSIVAHIPLNYIKITRHIKRELSDDEKRTLRERLAKSKK